MDFLDLAAATLVWRREFFDPVALMDDDLRALYAYKRSLRPPTSRMDWIHAEISERSVRRRRT